MINKDLKTNINYIKKELINAKDIIYKNYSIKNHKICIVYCESICDTSSINDFLLKNIFTLINKKEKIKNIKETLYETSLGNIKDVKNYKDLFNHIYNGFCIILIDKYSTSLAIEVRKNIYRAITEPMTEQTISGPKESFNESFTTNIGLIRKRIKTKDLNIKELFVGKNTKNKVDILYIRNIADKKQVNRIAAKIKRINIDGILDSTYIKEILASKTSSFPTIEVTERPDKASMALLEGRILIVVENSPYAIIIPTFFVDLFHSPEDNYQISINVTFTRIIRFLSFILAILLPAFYIAITTYNHETIPTSLLLNFVSQRMSVPFPAIVEAIGMILIFEVLRESDVRLPKFSGSAISILGAIVLGDAAVKAGIVSPIMLIIIATSAVCSLTFSNIAMINAIRLWRIIFMILATCFGIPGIFMAVFILLITIIDLDSFSYPYLYPIAPLNITFLTRFLFKLNIKKDNKRPKIITNNNTRSKL